MKPNKQFPSVEEILSGEAIPENEEEAFLLAQLRKHEEYRHAFRDRLAGKNVKCAPGTKMLVK